MDEMLEHFRLLISKTIICPCYFAASVIFSSVYADSESQVSLIILVPFKD